MVRRATWSVATTWAICRARALPLLRSYANEIFWQVSASHAMPPGQVIWVEDEERAMLAAWRDMVNKGLVDGNRS